MNVRELEDALKHLQYAIIELESVDPGLFERQALATRYVDIANTLQSVADDVRDIIARLERTAWSLEEVIAKARWLEDEGSAD